MVGNLPCLSHLGLKSHKQFALFFMFLKERASGKFYVPLEVNMFVFYKKCPACDGLPAVVYLACLYAPVFFLQVFVIVGAICSVSHRKERAPNLGEEWALSNSLSFPIWNFMHIPNRLKSNHKVWKKKKKKALRRILRASWKKKCFWGNRSLVADYRSKPGAELFSEFPELCSMPAMSRWHMS